VRQTVSVRDYDADSKSTHAMFGLPESTLVIVFKLQKTLNILFFIYLAHFF